MSLLRTDLQEGSWSSPPMPPFFMFLSLSWIFGHSSEKFFVIQDWGVPLGSHDSVFSLVSHVILFTHK